MKRPHFRTTLQASRQLQKYPNRGDSTDVAYVSSTNMQILRQLKKLAVRDDETKRLSHQVVQTKRVIHEQIRQIRKRAEHETCALSLFESRVECLLVNFLLIDGSMQHIFSMIARKMRDVGDKLFSNEPVLLLLVSTEDFIQEESDNAVEKLEQKRQFIVEYTQGTTKLLTEIKPGACRPEDCLGEECLCDLVGKQVEALSNLILRIMNEYLRVFDKAQRDVKEAKTALLKGEASLKREHEPVSVSDYCLRHRIDTFHGQISEFTGSSVTPRKVMAPKTAGQHSPAKRPLRTERSKENTRQQHTATMSVGQYIPTFSAGKFTCNFPITSLPEMYGSGRKVSSLQFYIPELQSFVQGSAWFRKPSKLEVRLCHMSRGLPCQLRMRIQYCAIIFDMCERKLVDILETALTATVGGVWEEDIKMGDIIGLSAAKLLITYEITWEKTR